MKQPLKQGGMTEDGLRRRPVTGRSSFSLIELLTVVAIIVVLSGIALRVTTYVQRKTGQVQTQRIIEQLKNALGEYYTVYGSYPPGINSQGTNVMSIVAFTTNFPALADGGYGYRRGLICYLWSGDAYNQDPEAQRWQHYLEGITVHKDPIAMVGGSMGFSMAWTNAVVTVNDGWGRLLRYQCYAPYQSYMLWSDGPNGRNETGRVDDIGVKWTE